MGPAALQESTHDAVELRQLMIELEDEKYFMPNLH
jgi:hypothetical protein